MEDNRLRRIKNIASKSFTYNKDINQHIESCKISIKIINEQEEMINILRTMLGKRDEEIRKLEEHNLALRKEKFIIEERKNIEIKEFREVITEQYKLIKDLSKKN